jgi:hypothetical protein
MATEMVLIPKSTYDLWKKQGGGKEASGKNVSMEDENGEAKKKEDTAVQKSSQHVNNNEDKVPPSTNNDTYKTVSSDLIDKFPVNYRLYAKRLLQYIKKNGGDIITWKNDDTTLIYRGLAQLDTDIIELVNYIFKTNARKPKGLDAFNIGLKEIKTPKAYLKPYLLRPPGITKSMKKKWVKY